MAADRGGSTASAVLPKVTSGVPKEFPGPRMDKDVPLVSDGNNCYPSVDRDLGISHEIVGLSAGERVRGGDQVYGQLLAPVSADRPRAESELANSAKRRDAEVTHTGGKASLPETAKLWKFGIRRKSGTISLQWEACLKTR